MVRIFVSSFATRSALICFLFIVGFAVMVFAYAEPGAAPTGGTVYAPLNTSNTGQSKAGGLILNTGGAANGLIVQNGNVGIGIVAPAEKLDVTGHIHSSGWVKAGTLSVVNNAINLFGGTAAGFGTGLSNGRVVGIGVNTVNEGGLIIGNGSTPNAAYYYDPVSNRARVKAGAGASIEFLTSSGWSSDVSRVYIRNSDGYVGIGTTNPTAPLQVNGPSVPLLLLNTNLPTRWWWIGPDNWGNMVVYNQGFVGQYMLNGGTTWIANSDERLKNDIQTLSDGLGLAGIKKLHPIRFTWKDAGALSDAQFGFAAQEVQRVFPQLVSTIGTTTLTLPDGTTKEIPDTLGLNYTGFIPPMVKAIQELDLKLLEENMALRKAIADLEKRVEALENR